ncbi:MAG: hypothetical protein ACI37Z_06155 [Candidatus Gastranaerophilaceae bacterium]
MKEIYEKPVVYIDEFKAIDVITTSDVTDDRDPADNDIPWGS